MVALKMASNAYSMSKKQKEELWRLHPNKPEPWIRLSTYRHVVGIDVVIRWMGLDWKFDTRNIICGIKRKKVLFRSKCLRRVAYKREKELQNVNTGFCHVDGAEVGISHTFNPHSHSTWPWHREVTWSSGRASEWQSGRELRQSGNRAPALNHTTPPSQTKQTHCRHPWV